MHDCFLSYICVEEVGGWRSGLFFVETGWGCVLVYRHMQAPAPHLVLVTGKTWDNAVSGRAAVYFNVTVSFRLTDLY